VDTIFWLLAIVLSVIITILIQSPLHSFLINVLGGWAPRKERGIKGVWHSAYSFDRCEGKSDTKEIITAKDLMVFKQIGNYVNGKSILGNSPAVYKMKGKIYHQMFFTGTWENIEEGSMYHGTFQLLISYRGDTMKGKWTSSSLHHQIRQGDWHFTLISRKIDSKSINEVIEMEKSNYSK